MTFLQELASVLYRRYNSDLSSLVVMFPSMRARTFFNDALACVADKPLWQPSYATIDEVMERIADISRGDRIVLITELFKIYKRHHPAETIDKFYFWGDMLISDFDMIDKYMVDAEQLLRNIEDLKELEKDVDYLEDIHIRSIHSFWRSIVDKQSLSKQKEEFLKIWRSLPHIYREYREQLLRLRIGYTGLIYREAAMKLKAGADIQLDGRRVIVAGFNALSNSEKCLMERLSTSEYGAEFYWDYDNYYTDNDRHEAGKFMRQNISDHPMQAAITHNNFAECNKKIESIGCVSNVVQCKYVAEILSKLPEEELDKRTAIVLTDENMLVPLLHSLPNKVKSVNVTMGYPLKATLAYTFIERLIELQKHGHRRKDDNADIFYHVDIQGILTHPYVVDTCGTEAAILHQKIVGDRLISVEGNILRQGEVLGSIFRYCDSYESLSQYIEDTIGLLYGLIAENDTQQGEYLRTAHEEIIKCKRSISKCDITLPCEVFTSMLRKHLQTVTIAYEGEPLMGVQIMGILETRNIDFKNVIILSMTDATFPGDTLSKASFIPYNLRVGYKMPTPEEHEAMYAYYFYRLIQRAERVSMLYCSKADDKSTGECSRYIHQLDYESQYKVNKYAVGVDLTLETPSEITVSKGKEEQLVLAQYLDDGEKKLSPTALFRYIECPMKFYFASVAQLNTANELNDNIDALTFGNILHETMEALYKNILDVNNPGSLIDNELCKHDVVAKAVNKTISKLLFRSADDCSAEFTGDTLLVRDIVIKYILQGILNYDKEHNGYAVVALEEKIASKYPLMDGRSVNIGGIADRIDRLSDGTIQVIDYKSSVRPHLKFNDIERLFTGNSDERVANIFQTLLYSEMIYRERGCDVLPTLYFASQMLLDGYFPKLVSTAKGGAIERYSEVRTEFTEHLQGALEELFNYDVPFKQADESLGMCKLCDFKKICRRKNEQ